MKFKLLVPFGIFIYIMFMVTLLMGMRVIKVQLKLHRIFGIASVCLGTLHAIVMIYINYFL